MDKNGRVKSYFLESPSNYHDAWSALSRHLPRWVEPWLLKDDAGDVVAYINLERDDAGPVLIQADLSGRHHEDTDKVVGLLRSLQSALGGKVTDDDDTVL